MMQIKNKKETALFIFRSCGLFAGIEKGTFHLSQFIDPAKTKMTVVATKGEYWQIYKQNAPHVKLVDFPFNYEESRLKRFIRALTFFRQQKADKVIWLHNRIEDFFIWEIAASWISTKGKTYISHHNIPWSSHEGSTSKTSFQLRHLFARKILSISKDITDSLTNVWKIPPEKITTQPRGIDKTVFCPDENQKSALRKKLNLSNKSKLMIAVLRFSNEKRIDRLLGSFLLLRRKDIEASLLVVGDGPLRQLFEKRVKVNKLLNGCVHFLGFRTDINKFIQGADYLLLSSDKEGQSAAIKEAMACGTIPISTDSPGSRGISKNIFISQNNAFDFARVIQKALNLSEREQDVLRKALVDEVAKNFDFETCSRNMLATYDLPSREFSAESNSHKHILVGH